MINKARDYLIKFIDLIFIIILISFLICDLMTILISLIEIISKLSQQWQENLIIFMVENSNNTIPSIANQGTEGHATNVQIIHNDGGWGNSVRSIFIYATGALRLSLLRGGGTPSSRAFVIGSTLAAESVTRVFNNAINDPTYIRSHIENWRILWKDNNPKEGTIEIHLGKDLETNSMLDTISTSEKIGSNNTSNITEVNKFISDGNGIDELANKIFSLIMDYLSPILSPVKVNYSNELLANQLNDISLLLFILSIFIIVLFIAFMFNIIFFIYSDKISNFFTNKYIK
jgi:hypothetical protein